MPRHLTLVSPPAEEPPASPPARVPGWVGTTLIACVAAAAVSCYVLIPPALAPSRQDMVVIALLLGLAAVAERFDVGLYGDSHISVSVLFGLTTAVTFGAPAVMITEPVVALAAHLGRSRGFIKLLFNASAFVATGLASVGAYSIAALLLPGHGQWGQMMPIMLAAAANFTTNSLLVTAIISATSGDSPAQVWREKFAWLIPQYAGIGFLAFVLKNAYVNLGIEGVLGFVVPVAVLQLSMKQYVARTEQAVSELREQHTEIQELSDEVHRAYGETLHAFVAALDARDSETHGHSSRVMELSASIADVLGFEPGSKELEDLKNGAMLHDVGKIGVADAVLRKPGGLTEDEWVQIREHPRHGYEMLRSVGFLAAAAELVLCHHERWDGNGYPRGLRGEDIPLAARIFAVADTFDAITSARPYKPSCSEDEAISEIVRCSGTQFDPRVVEAMLAMMRVRARRAA